jgi:TP901 family phage tail tape measure protein
MSVRTVSVALVAQVQSFIRPLGAAGGAVRRFGGELNNLARTSPHHANRISTALAGVGVGMLALGGYAAKTAADFDKAMSHVGAVANATGGELNQMRAAALKAGKETSFSAMEAAQAEEELAKAGISTANILGGALDGALDLAAAGSLDLAEAAAVAAKAMNIFHLEGKDVPHIADVLASAANKSATDVHELSEALKMGGIAASTAGWSLEETTGILAAFADRGLAGSDAGTSLKTAIMMLQAPTQKSAELMERLGLTVYDANGQFVTTDKLAGQLQTQLGKLTAEERNHAIATIFGSDAMRGANILYDLGAEGARTYAAEMNDSGAAARTAGEKTDNLAGDIERLKGSIQTMAIEAGSGANGGLRALVQGLDKLLDLFADLPAPLQSSIVIFAGVSGAALLAAAGILKMRTMVAEMTTALTAMGTTGAATATFLGRFGKLAGGLTLAAIALYGVYEGYKLLLGEMSTKADPARRDVDGLVESLKELANTGRVTGELQRAFGDSLRNLTVRYAEFKAAQADANQTLRNTSDGLADIGRGMNRVQGNMAGIADTSTEVAGQFKEDIGAVDKALAELVKSGGVTQAKLAFEKMAELWVAGGKPLEELTSRLPQYAAAADSATFATGGAAKGFGDASDNARTMARSLEAAMAAGQSLKDVFEQLNGSAISLSDAQIAVENGTRELTEALKESHGSLDIMSEKGAAARSALNDLARKAAEAAQAVYDQTGSAADASAAFESYRTQIINTLVQMGVARQEAERLARELLNLPKSIPINVTYTTTYRTNGTPSQGNSRNPGINSAGGNLIDYFASGGVRESHNAMIAPAGSMRTWGEPETGGEGYIPLSPSKRQQSTALLRTINGRFGNPLGGTVYAPQITFTVNAGMGVNGAQLGAQVVDVIRQYERNNGSTWRR